MNLSLSAWVLPQHRRELAGELGRGFGLRQSTLSLSSLIPREKDPIAVPRFRQLSQQYSLMSMLSRQLGQR